MRQSFKKPPKRSTISLALLIILLMPTVPFYAGLASSLALGTSIAAAILIATWGIGGSVRLAKSRPTVLTSGALVTLIVSGIAMHATLASLAQPFDAVRAVASVIPLTLVLLSGCAFGRALATARSADIDRAVYQCFGLLCIVVLLATIGAMQPTTGPYFQPVFPFTEPSHFSLTFIPVLMFCCVTSKGYRCMLFLLLGVAAALLLQSLTLIVGCFLVAYTCFRGTVFLFLVIALGLAATQLDLSYYVARLDFAGEQNLSNLVYLQGWQLVGESLARSNGWGLGFQQLGLVGTNVPASDLIYTLVGNYLNVLDGGFTFAKLSSEFGVLGLILTVLYLGIAWRAIRTLREVALGKVRLVSSMVLSHSVFAGYLIEYFVRGSGYFTGTAILLVASLWLLSTRSHAQLVLPPPGGQKHASRSFLQFC